MGCRTQGMGSGRHKLNYTLSLWVKAICIAWGTRIRDRATVRARGRVRVRVSFRVGVRVGVKVK